MQANEYPCADTEYRIHSSTVNGGIFRTEILSDYKITELLVVNSYLDPGASGSRLFFF